MSTTSDPAVLREAVADVALKTYTVYFLLTSIMLGILLFLAIRKASKVCCWRCMYGSKFTRDDKEDPRVPATLFRAPSVLNKLQDHYNKSFRSTAKSAATTYGYTDARDIEYGTSDDKTRVHRYMDSAEGTEHAQITSQDSESGDTLKSDKINTISETIEEDEQHNDKQVLILDHWKSPDPTQLNDNGFSHYDLASHDTPSEEGTSQRVSPDIELHDMGDPDYGTIGINSTVSDESPPSTTSDAAPLVSMEPSGTDSMSSGFIRRGRYKKNASQTSQPGTSTRSASAKSSKRNMNK